MTLHELIADKLERADAETRPALLRIPLDNIDRWLSQAVVSAAKEFLRWRTLLKSAAAEDREFRRLIEILRSESAEACRWRDFSPFAGVLSSAERRQFIRQCAYSH